ncbi:MAG: hypothetical protein MJ252_15690, partial [archaeon]|nr:hypothetical protein [archaeon]
MNTIEEESPLFLQRKTYRHSEKDLKCFTKCRICQREIKSFAICKYCLIPTCRKCITDSLKKKKRCPHCKKPLLETQLEKSKFLDHFVAFVLEREKDRIADEKELNYYRKTYGGFRAEVLGEDCDDILLYDTKAENFHKSNNKINLINSEITPKKNKEEKEEEPNFVEIDLLCKKMTNLFNQDINTLEVALGKINILQIEKDQLNLKKEEDLRKLNSVFEKSMKLKKSLNGDILSGYKQYIAVQKLIIQKQTMDISEVVNSKDDKIKSLDVTKNMFYNMQKTREALADFLTNFHNYYISEIELINYEKMRNLSSAIGPLYQGASFNFDSMGDELGKIEYPGIKILGLTWNVSYYPNGYGKWQYAYNSFKVELKDDIPTPTKFNMVLELVNKDTSKNEKVIKEFICFKG